MCTMCVCFGTMLEFDGLSYSSRLDEDSFVGLLMNDEVHSYDQVTTAVSGDLCF